MSDRAIKNAAWRKTRLLDVTRHHSGNGKLIKGKLSDAPTEGLFPAFSASGQDVWRDAYEHEGDAIIVSAVGARCGKCFLATEKWSAVANTHVVWPDVDKIDRKFLWYRINDERFWIRSGSAQPFVVVRKSLERDFLLPPLEEQQEIVAEIEKQFTWMEAGVMALRRVQANLKRYRAAVLIAACEGKLTEEANKQLSLPDALLDLAESSGGVEDAEETLPVLPASWRWVQVGKVLHTRQGVQIAKSEQREAECRGFKRYLYISDFKHSESLKFVEDKYPAQEVTERDLVMANTGSPGEVFRGTNGILSNNLFRISFNAEHFDHRFVYYYFKSPLFLSRIKLKGGAQQHLGHRTIGAHLMPLPPLAEQTRIVAEVERRLSVAEELELIMSANLQRAIRLRQSILHRAFEGGLDHLR